MIIIAFCHIYRHWSISTYAMVYITIGSHHAYKGDFGTKPNAKSSNWLRRFMISVVCLTLIIKLLPMLVTKLLSITDCY